MKFADSVWLYDSAGNILSASSAYVFLVVSLFLDEVI